MAHAQEAQRQEQEEERHVAKQREHYARRAREQRQYHVDMRAIGRRVPLLAAGLHL